MTYTIGLAVSRHPQTEGWESTLAMVDGWCARAAEQRVELLVFPEYLMTRFEIDPQRFDAEAQPINGPFVLGMGELAAKYGMWIAFTMNELNDAGGHPYNTAVIVDAEGQVRGSYRKTHLFDASTDKESNRIAAGDELFAPIDTPFGKLVITICYDLRFPEVARKAALAGCELFINMAGWVAGEGKLEQYAALVAGRAVENEMFACGVSRCDKGYVGQAIVVAPNGKELGRTTEDEALLTVSIDLGEMARMRAWIPVLDHRRPELY